MSITAVEQDRMAARLAEIRPFLDERAWRLLLGAEARAIGVDTVTRSGCNVFLGLAPE